MQASSIESYFATPFGFLVCVAVLLCASSYLVGSLAGWRLLARRFQTDSEAYGDMHSAGPFFYTVYLRFWIHYSSVIMLTATNDGLYLSVLAFFRIGHPPLRIPWDEIKLARTHRFFITYIELKLGNQERIPMRISQRMARNLSILDRVPV